MRASSLKVFWGVGDGGWGGGEKKKSLLFLLLSQNPKRASSQATPPQSGEACLSDFRRFCILLVGERWMNSFVCLLAISLDCKISPIPLVIFTLVPDPFRATFSATLALKYGLFCSLPFRFQSSQSSYVFLMQDGGLSPTIGLHCRLPRSR